MFINHLGTDTTPDELQLIGCIKIYEKCTFIILPDIRCSTDNDPAYMALTPRSEAYCGAHVATGNLAFNLEIVIDLNIR